jgi:hypothetical protein
MTGIWRTQVRKATPMHAEVRCPSAWGERSTGDGNSHWAVDGGVSNSARWACQASMIAAVAAVMGSRRRIRPAL